MAWKNSEDKKAYFRKRREEARKNGCCPAHPHTPVVLGKKSCQKCLDTKKLKYERRRKEGVCPSHPNKPCAPGKSTCQECINKKKIKSKELIKNGFCPIHPHTPSTPGMTICKKCTQRGKATRKKLRENGMCFVHKNRKAVSKTRCSECLLDERIGLMRRRGVSESELIKAGKAYANFEGYCQACGLVHFDFQSLVSDHDHVTKNFRGIICDTCNLALGLVGDDPEKLEMMASYLRGKRFGAADVAHIIENRP